MHIACMFQCDGDKASVEACVHWPLLPLRMRKQSPVLTLRGLGTSGSLSSGWEKRENGLESRKGLGEWQPTVKILTKARSPWV